MGVAKKVIDKVKEAIKPKVVKVIKTEEVKTICSNCNDSGLACSSCSVPFSDTFGE